MKESLTVIGARTLVTGTIEGDEELVVEGRLEGSVRVGGSVVIEVDGEVHADVEARAVLVHGVLVGDITATETVFISEQGRVMGDIRAPHVTLAEGASFRGNIDMGAFDGAELGGGKGTDRGAPSRSRFAHLRSRRHGGNVPAPVEKQRPLARPFGSPEVPTAPATPVAAAFPEPTPVVGKASPPPPKVRSIGKGKAFKKGPA